MALKPKPIIDPMASQTCSQLFIPDDPITALPPKSKKTKKKPAPATVTSDSVPVETLSTGDTPGETVPAPWEMSVDITGGASKDSAVIEDDNKEDSPHKKPALLFTSRTLKGSVDNANDNKNDPDDNDSADNDMENNGKKNDFVPNKDDNEDDVDDDPISNKQASLDYSFLFKSSTSCSGLADGLNESYDLSFRSDELFTNRGVLTNKPTRILHQILPTLLETTFFEISR